MSICPRSLYRSVKLRLQYGEEKSPVIAFFSDPREILMYCATCRLESRLRKFQINVQPPHAVLRLPPDPVRSFL